MFFIRKITEESTKRGLIEGLLLTGLTKEGVDLFEAYIDRSGDVQTASLVLCRVVPKFFQDKRVPRWIEMYFLYYFNFFKNK